MVNSPLKGTATEFFSWRDNICVRQGAKVIFVNQPPRTKREAKAIFDFDSLAVIAVFRFTSGVAGFPAMRLTKMWVNSHAQLGIYSRTKIDSPEKIVTSVL